MNMKAINYAWCSIVMSRNSNISPGNHSVWHALRLHRASWKMYAWRKRVIYFGAVRQWLVWSYLNSHVWIPFLHHAIIEEKKILLFHYKMCLRIFTTSTFTFLYKYNIISLFIFFGRLIIISSGLVYLFKILNKIIILLYSIDNRYDVYAHRYTYMQLPI